MSGFTIEVSGPDAFTLLFQVRVTLQVLGYLGVDIPFIMNRDQDSKKQIQGFLEDPRGSFINLSPGRATRFRFDSERRMYFARIEHGDTIEIALDLYQKEAIYAAFRKAVKLIDNSD